MRAICFILKLLLKVVAAPVILAFLISPYGLPMAAIWLLGKVQDLKFAIKDRVYG